MNFNANFSQWYLKESILDIARDSLDPNVFQFPEVGAPIIHQRIRSQIMTDLVEINNIVTILDYFVIGSILTPNYNSTTDLDVTIEVEEEIGAVKQETLVELLRKLNGKLAVGTMHPINYYIVKGQFNMDNTEAAYDIADERWLKEPQEHSFNVRKYANKLKAELATVDLATAELRRDLLDLKELKSLSKDDISGLDLEIKKVLSEVESDIQKIVQTYENAKILRKNAFDKAMSPSEIRKFGAKNNLPENVLYKLLERYFYKDFARKLKDILSGGVEESDIPDIRKTFKDFLAKV
jgi:hypothetical protein